LKAHPPGAPLLKIHLAAEPAPPRPAQSGLFVPPSPEPEKLELTLAKIAGIVGEERAGSLRLLDTHRPEGFRMQRFAAASNLNEKLQIPRLARDDNSLEPDLVAALRIFRPPHKVSVSMQDGRPTHIASANKKEMQGKVLWTAGPWRSSGDWWEQEGWARDEWDIAVQQPTGIVFYRLVRDGLSGRWLLEGSYD
jgi:protein ImuB